MSWKKQTLRFPIPKEVTSIVDTVGIIPTTLSPILSVVSSLLTVAKFIYGGSFDLFKKLVGGLIGELEDLINDLFGTGMFMLVVQPFDAEGKLTYDSEGIPIITPAQAIKTAQDSFDDLGDENRPIFSDDAVVVGFGFLITAPDLPTFKYTLDSVLNIFDIPQLRFTLKKFEETEPTPKPPSVKPDWDGLKFNSIDGLKEVQEKLLGVVGLLNGMMVTPDDNVNDLIDSIGEKVTNLQNTVDEFQALLDQLKGSINIDGLYMWSADKLSGGTNYLKEQLSSSKMNEIKDTYSAMVLFVGGGPSLIPVNAMKELIM